MTTVNVPAPTGSDDVAMIQNVINSAPDGVLGNPTTIAFPTDAFYLCEGQLTLNARTRLSIAGNGAELHRSQVIGDTSSPQVVSGAVTDLQTDNDVYLVIRSPYNQSGTLRWYGVFNAIPLNPTTLTLTYKGKISSSFNQKVYVQKWAKFLDDPAEAWVEIDSRSVGPTEVGFTLTCPTPITDYISQIVGRNGVQPGDFRFRIVVTGSGTYDLSADLMNITVDGVDYFPNSFVREAGKFAFLDQLLIQNSDFTTVDDLRVVSNGTGVYDPNVEFEAAILVAGCRDTTLTNNYISHPAGDAYVSAWYQVPGQFTILNERMHVTGGTAIAPGRDGFSTGSSFTDVVIDHVNFSQVARSVVDLELENAGAVVTNFTFADNIADTVNLNFIAGAGIGTHNGVNILRNVVQSLKGKYGAAGTTPNRFNITFNGNTASDIFLSGILLSFRNCDTLTVVNNSQPIAAGATPTDYSTGTSACTNVFEQGNSWNPPIGGGKMSYSDYLEAKINDAVCNNTSLAVAQVYVKLHTGDPGENGTQAAATETTRKAASFGPSSGTSPATCTSDADITWTNVAGTETISHISLWDASTAGNCLGSGALTSSRNVTAGDTLQILTGALTFSSD